MHHPDRIVRTDRNAADLTQQQVIGHGRPGGIHLEARHLGAGGRNLFKGEGGERLLRRRSGGGNGEGQGEGSGEEGAHRRGLLDRREWRSRDHARLPGPVKAGPIKEGATHF